MTTVDWVAAAMAACALAITLGTMVWVERRQRHRRARIIRARTTADLRARIEHLEDEMRRIDRVTKIEHAHKIARRNIE